MSKQDDVKALLDAGDLLQALENTRGGRFAVIYDPGKGWCITDDMDTLKPKMGPAAPEFRVIAYEQWFQPTLAEAFVSALQVKQLRQQELRSVSY